MPTTVRALHAFSPPRCVSSFVFLMGGFFLFPISKLQCFFSNSVPRDGGGGPSIFFPFSLYDAGLDEIITFQRRKFDAVPCSAVQCSAVREDGTSREKMGRREEYRTSSMQAKKGRGGGCVHVKYDNDERCVHVKR